jgi:tetratricopeptide (TPR) repeat protein
MNIYRKRKIVIHLIIFLSILLIALQGVGFSEIYKWTNDDGSIGLTDDISKVPEKYRYQIKNKIYSDKSVKESVPDHNTGVYEFITNEYPNYFACQDKIIEEKFEEAIISCKKALINVQHELETGFIYSYLGYIYMKLGKEEEATEAYRLAMLPQAKNPNIRNLADSYALVGMMFDAYFKAKEALEKNPNDAKAHYELGLGYIMFNKKEKALEEYQLLKELDSEKAEELLEFYKKTENSKSLLINPNNPMQRIPE